MSTLLSRAKTVQAFSITVAFFLDSNILVSTSKTVDKARVAPQKACVPAQDLGTMAPATGLPIKMPNAAKNAFMPSRAPIVLMSVVIDATATGCNETKAPEKNPYSRQKTIMPAAVLLIAIQQKPRIAAQPVQIARTTVGEDLSAIRPGMIRPKIEPVLKKTSI